MRTDRLVERVVRDDDIFCSLLYNYDNRTLRVIDFFEGGLFVWISILFFIGYYEMIQQKVNLELIERIQELENEKKS